jgi:hypothetical protein
MRMRHLLLPALLAVAPATVQAQTFDQGRIETRPHLNPDMAAQAEHGIESENLFGLTLGSDIDGAGSRAAALEVNGRIGARSGRYAAIGTKLEFAYGATENLSIAGSVLAGWRNSRNVPGQSNLNALAFDGVGAELRWRFLERGPSPVGLTLHIEPSLRVADERTGERGLGWAFENRLILDTALVPDRLFAAANLIYDIEAFRPKGAPQERASTAGLSAALTYQLRPGLFLGADIRYLRAYEGLALERYRGWAVFAGPTLFWYATENVWLSATYAFQLAGREHGVAATYDLGNFPRQMLKFKIGMEF